MSVEDFVARLKIEMAALEKPCSSPQADADYMKGLALRGSLFRSEATRILSEIVEPRMKALGSLFPNANPPRNQVPDHCIWWFGYTERFPASTKVDVAVVHDERIETIGLRYELLIVPVFIKYDRFDRLDMPLDQINSDLIAEWLEKRLLAFLYTYMSLGLSDRDQMEGTATDPVCGMRIEKNGAAAFYDHAGHRYYFCSSACREEFAHNPARHVTIVTL